MFGKNQPVVKNGPAVPVTVSSEPELSPEDKAALDLLNAASAEANAVAPLESNMIVNGETDVQGGSPQEPPLTVAKPQIIVLENGKIYLQQAMIFNGQIIEPLNPLPGDHGLSDERIKELLDLGVLGVVK